jgi:hypothetical protein
MNALWESNFKTDEKDLDPENPTSYSFGMKCIRCSNPCSFILCPNCQALDRVLDEVNERFEKQGFTPDESKLAGVRYAIAEGFTQHLPVLIRDRE